MGLGGDVGLCVRPGPWHLASWEAGRLEVCRLIKRKRLFLCQTRTRQVRRGEKKGASGAQTFTPKRVSSYRSGVWRRSAASSGQAAAMSGKDCATDPLAVDPVAGEETGVLGDGMT